MLNDSSNDLVEKQEVIEEKLFYLIIGFGVLFVLVVLVPIGYFVGLKIKMRFEAEEYYDNYYYEDPKL